MEYLNLGNIDIQLRTKHLLFPLNSILVVDTVIYHYKFDGNYYRWME